MEYFPDSTNYFTTETCTSTNDTENICYICYNENNDKSIELSCKHMFHRECIKMNINSIKNNSILHCPYCHQKDISFDISCVMDNIPEIELLKSKVKIYKRKAPNDMAKNFEVGYLKISENNNEQYVVYEDKNNIKKWKKKPL